MDNTISKKTKKDRVVEKDSEKIFFCCGKKTNKNVYELQKLYESTQYLTPKVIPEFFERIKFMIVNGICRATWNHQCLQDSELFNYVVESVLAKIVPKYDSKTNSYKTQYDITKTNIGAYILNSCYWATREYVSKESSSQTMLNYSEFLEDYDKVSKDFVFTEINMFKLIYKYDFRDELAVTAQKILLGRTK